MDCLDSLGWQALIALPCFKHVEREREGERVRERERERDRWEAWRPSDTIWIYTNQGASSKHLKAAVIWDQICGYLGLGLKILRFAHQPRTQEDDWYRQKHGLSSRSWGGWCFRLLMLRDLHLQKWPFWVPDVTSEARTKLYKESAIATPKMGVADVQLADSKQKAHPAAIALKCLQVHLLL